MDAFAPILVPIREICSSRKPLMLVFKGLVVMTVALMALASLFLTLQTLFPPMVYQKDFMQEYLLARAVLAGVSPYLPLPDLAERLLGPLPVPLMPHPTPHPPPVALLSLPLGLLAYVPAAAVWLAFELLCAGLAVYLLLRWLVGRPRPAQLLAAILFFLLWTPFKDALSVGQLLSLLLLLLVGTYLSFSKGRDGLGGLLLGAVFALKLFAWPVLIYLLLRRNFRALAAAAGAWFALNLGAAVLMGWQEVVTYYTTVGRQVEPLYRAHERNYALWSVGFRLFEGTASPVVAGVEAPPLIDVPGLAPFVSALLVLITLVVGLTLACRALNFVTAFAILICTSLLVGPLAWSHSLILASLPIAVILRGISNAQLNRREAYAALGVGLLLFTATGLRGLIFVLAGQEQAEAASLMVPFGVSLLTLLPAVGVLGLVWLAWRVDTP